MSASLRHGSDRLRGVLTPLRAVQLGTGLSVDALQEGRVIDEHVVDLANSYNPLQPCQA